MEKESKLSALLKDVDYFEITGRNERVAGLACDVSAVTDGCLFFCLTGTKADGHDFAAEAVRRGARVLAVERFLPVPVTQVLVRDARGAMSRAAGNFYGNPARKMKLIGVTGTNGKTTTTYIIREIGKAYGIRTGLIGTTCNMIKDEILPAHMTTPDPIELHKLLAMMLKAGVEWVVTEVSAHALDLRKLDGVRFDVAVFTNFSQDHLDYFGDMDAYKAAKKSLFTPVRCRRAVLNADDPVGREIAASDAVPYLTYGYENPSEVFAVNLQSGADGVKYVINVSDEIREIGFRLPGRHNMYNTLAAAAAARLLGAGMNDIAEGIGALRRVPGRFEILDVKKPFSVAVDFAHTPEGITNVCRCAREFCKGRVITVFGCGGDRDKTKRPLMGRAAGMGSDFAVLTSDNPRGEVPAAIMKDAEAGLRAGGCCSYAAIEDRREAIAYALKFASFGDVVLILGKGDENYQEINGVKTPFSDADTVYSLLGEGKAAV